MSLELADRSIQYLRGIAEDMLIQIDKFILPIDFVILDMREDSRILIILGRPFLETARAMIDVFNKKITLRVGSEEVIFDVDQSMKKPRTKDDECYGIDDLDTVIQSAAQKLLENDHRNKNLEDGINQPDSENHATLQLYDLRNRLKEQQVRVLDLTGGCYSRTSHDGNPMKADWTESNQGLGFKSLERKKDWKARMKDGEARDWLDKEPPRSILTWDDLVLKFINQFFPPSKTTYLRNEITTFYQKPNETFNEAWERFKGLLRQCPHHGFSELHQLDTFYNSLNTNDQDALDSAAGGNFLDKMPREGLAIIESKSKVRYSRSRPNDSRAITNAPSSTSSPSNNSFEIQQMAALLEDKMNIRMSRLEKAISEKNATTPATVKAVEEVCVTCGSNHNFNNCPLTRNDSPVFQDNIHQFQQTAAVGNFVQRNPPNLANQMRPPGFYQPNVQNNQGNQNRYQGNNFNSNQNRRGNFNQNHQNNQGAVYQASPYQPPMNQPPVYQAPTQQKLFKFN
ncbi:reverse transcriptase domain-containing protein [Tanacetum coccineum]